MATEGAIVGTAVLQVIPSMKGGVKGLEKELGGGMSTAGSSAGKKFSKGFADKTKGIGKGLGKVLKGGAIGLGAAAVGGIGVSLNAGFKRLGNIDQAEAKLKGLGHTQQNIDKIMKNSLESVKGTAFGLDSAASTSAGLVASGIKPGKALTETLKLVGDTATIAGIGMDEMGAIFNKVAAGDKLDMDVVNQLQDRGIPVLQALSKESGKSVDQVRKDLSAGKIDFEEFSTSMESTLGGAALESGNTFSGAMSNVKAAMGRTGAAFLDPFFEAGPGLLTSITDKLDGLTPIAEKAGKFVNGAFSKMSGGAKGIFDLFVKGDFSSSFAKAFGVEEDSPIVGTLFDIREAVIETFGKAKKAVSDAWKLIGPYVSQFGTDMAALGGPVKELGKTMGTYFLAVWKAVAPYLKIVAGIVGVVLVGAMKLLPPILKIAIKALTWLFKTVKPFLPVLAKLAVVFGAVFLAINAPIVAIIAFGAALVLLYKKNETFRKFIDKAWAKIKGAISSVVDWFTKTAWPALKKAFAAVSGFAMDLWNKGIKPAFAGIGKVISWWYTNVVKRYFALVGKVFKALGAVAKWLWDKGIKPAFEFIKAGAQSMADKFVSVRDGIKTTWAKARAFVETPIRLAVDWVKKKALQIADGFLKTRDRLKRGWDKAKEMVMKPIRSAVDWIKDKAVQVYTGFISVRDRFNRGWARIKEMAMKPIRSAVDWIKTKAAQVATGFFIVRDRFKRGWARITEMVKSPVRDGVDWVKDKADQVKKKFTDIRDGISKVWAKLEGKIKSPIKKALTWINDNLIGKVNVVLKKVEVPEIDEIPGFASGGWTGKGSKYQPAGVVHADEFVVSKASRRKFESENPGVLNHINRTGRMPGYYMGGKVDGLNKDFLSRLSQWNDFNGNKYMVNSGYRSIEHQTRLWNASDKSGRMVARPGSSNHNFGIAADLGPPTSAISRGNAGKFGLKFPMSWEPWHIEPIGIGKDGLAGTPLDKGWDSVEGWIKKSGLPLLGKQMWEKGTGALKNFISNRIPNIGDKFGKFGEMGFGMVKRSFGNVNKDFRDGVLGQYASARDGALAGMQSYKDISPGGGVERWRGTVLNALKIMGLSDKYANSTLRRMDQESGGAPRIVNDWDINAKNGTPSKGLMQVIDPTFRAHAHPSYNKNIFDPLSNILASMRYAQFRYGSLWAAYDRKGGYADGGHVKPLLFDSGGYLPPGVSMVHNKTGKPEPLGRMDTMGTGNITVYVQSPWGKDYMESKVRDVVNEEDNYASTIRRMN